MPSITVYVAGPVLRPGDDQSPRVGALYAELQITAEARTVNLTLPTYSDRLEHLAADAFAREIREQIQKADATIAVIARPARSDHIFGYSIAVEAQEAAKAGKPIALLGEDAEIAIPRLLAALDRVQSYAFTGPGSLDVVFDHLANEIGHPEQPRGW